MMDAPAKLTEMCFCTISLAHCDAGWERPSHHPQNSPCTDWHFYVLLILQIGTLEELTSTDYWLYIELTAIPISAPAK